MEWIEQKDATKIVRWGQLEGEETKDSVYLVKKNEDLIGTVKSIDLLHLKNMTTQALEDKPALIIELQNKETVRFITPTMLMTDLGLNPKMVKEHKVSVGDLVKITYLGKKKEKNMHLFKVLFGKR